MQVATTSSEVDAGYYLGVYAVLGVAYMFITLFREGVLFSGSIGASKRIHRQLMESITRAKFRFFDSTPLGQIMNRFSKDIEAIDQEVAPVAVGFVHCLFSIITIIILISAITPGFLIAGFFITILYFLIGRFYISSSRDLKRLESIQRSPLYQQFGETMSGTTTIRAYGDERRFIRDNLNKINTHSRPFIYLWAANRWLAFRVDVVGALVSFFAGAFVVTSVGKIDAGAAGLAMTYAVTFTENVLWFVRLYSSNEQNMNSVERIKEYLDVDQEADLIVEDNRPAANWPSKGSVEFIGYTTRYRSDFDPVLKNITFKVLPGEKVGVVGRTGAGKSSLALALFRALEAEQGKILIDDVDIGLIGLQDLRENIVMVPQDPTLFTGTLRTNLDPFGLFTDEEIFTALRGVQLVSAPSAANSRPETPVQTLRKNDKRSPASSTTAAGSITDTSAMENKNIFRNLSSTVAESGSNLSQGQRQLLCLARALLKAPKVLLMDEATASIDYATDARIQDTIREIKNTTLTIAHRLQTIIDYDKVLVLDKGEIVEFGDPFDLISKTDGVFHGMCEMSGDLEVLEREAKRAHVARKLVDDL
jgi:ABC-type multidrug transport system fused ATPase/permease subunit